MTITKVQYLNIEEAFANQRIDNFLIKRLKGMPKSHVYRILRKGEVRVNKKRIGPDYKLQTGDQLRIPPVKLDIAKKPAQPKASFQEFLKTRILYEDNALLIINKPAGIPVHGGTGVKLGLIEALRAMFPKSPHLELAHRLDLDTSGCLILAKKRSILKEIHELLRMGKVRKIYQTLTKGHWLPSELRVEVPLQKNQLSSGERIVKVQREGKPSLTFFTPMKIFKEATLVSAELLTGRTHQIRVHCQYRHHPIAGDEKYGDRDFNKRMREYGIKRLFLHSHQVEFTLSSGQHIKVVANLDEDLAKCLSHLEK